MTSPSDPARQAGLSTAGLPARVRQTLERALALVCEDLDRGMERMLAEFERELFRLADLARNPGAESGYMQAVRSFRLHRGDLLPRFMLEVERSLASLRQPPDTPPPQQDDPHPDFRNLSLVETTVMDEDTVLREIASRQEGRATLALHLLGQRFGVLAGTPAFDAPRLPLGPHALCRAMRMAATGVEISYDARLLLYRMFDRQLMASYPQVLDRLNELLAAEGILPALSFVPVRTRPGTGTASQKPGHDAGTEPQPQAGPQPAGTDPDCPAATGHGPQPYTVWPGQPHPHGSSDDSAFAILQQLLAGRRELIGKLRPEPFQGHQQALSTPDLADALHQFQHHPAAVRTSLPDIKRAILGQARESGDAIPALSRADSDTFELINLLYGQIENETRADAPTAPLLRDLQLPLLRVALLDRNFFIQSEHPARQLLNTVAESAAHWTDDGEIDASIVESLRSAVAGVVEQFKDDPAVFADANDTLQKRMQLHARKAESLERRHVEAARGKEKLEIARRRAASVLDETISGRRLPRFTRALLTQAWADVLTLTLLRQGEQSGTWQQQLQTTRQIIEACAGEATPATPELTSDVEASLSQVGYHSAEASVIAQRLTASSDTGENTDDAASRTELAMKLKARARLGEERIKAEKPARPPRTAREQAHYEQLRTLPFGCWFEFVLNQQGDVVRRRLSWYSRITDNALFVNQRGQRVCEYTLDHLARLMTTGQVHLVTAERGRLVDRAWQATVSALRSFAGRGNGDHTPSTAKVPAA